MSKRPGQEYWQGHLAGWLESGQTQQAYCERHGLSMATFHRWRRKQKMSLVAKALDAGTDTVRIGGCEERDPPAKPRRLENRTTGCGRGVAGRTATPTAMMPTAAQVWLVVEPLDMRAGIDGLSLRIQNTLARSPCDGKAYAFRNRRGNRIKLLIWDGTGVWLCQRRLHKGHFTWPTAQATVHTDGCPMAMARERRGLAAAAG